MPQRASTGRFGSPHVPGRRQPARSGTGWPESQPWRKTGRARSPAPAGPLGSRGGRCWWWRCRSGWPRLLRSAVLSPGPTAAATSGSVRRSWISRRRGVAATPHPLARTTVVQARRYLRQRTKRTSHPKGEQACRTRDKSGRWLLPHDRSYGSSNVVSIPVTLLPIIQRPSPGCRSFRRVSRSPWRPTCCPELLGT